MRSAGAVGAHIDIDVRNAKLLMKYTPASCHIERIRGGFEMSSRPPVMHIDNTAFFESIGIKSDSAILRDSAERAAAAVLESMARCTAEAKELSKIIGASIGELIEQRSLQVPESVLTFIPEEGPHISWEPARLDIEYTPDDIRFSWNTGGVEFRYIPYRVSFSVDA